MNNELKLENQICFPLYAASKEIVRLYTPYLKDIDLTYTQYITMMVMWEVKEINVKELGNKLFLDSGTLTPLLKKLESKGYVERNRLSSDERNLIVKVTEKGLELQDMCKNIPGCVAGCVNITKEEAENLYKTLYKILGNIKED
jgi:DNA-binding MarR family transcriptional regulator